MTRWMLAVVVTVTVAVGCGGNESSKRGSPTSKTGGPAAQLDGGRPGRLVEIGGGRRLFLHCVGSGSPTVVLESGAGSNAMQWQEVQSELGRTTRTCAYDRAGIGNSVAPPGVRDARNEIADLRRLLDHVRVDPPYVLVGHSYGGVLALVFAHLHPTEVGGLVLIDTMGRDGRRRQLAIWPKSQAPEIRRELATTVIGGVDLAVGEALASRVRTPADTPLAVITAGRQDNFPRTPARLARNLRRLWDRMHDELAGLSDNSVHVIALRSNHDVPSPQSGQPSVVISAAQAVVRAAREHTRLPQCRHLFKDPDVRCRS
jgi:pimeloyl-ACP methyl ester carboxylesterase